MPQKQYDMTAAEAAAALIWLAEMGADEAIGETAIDRFAASMPKQAAEPTQPAPKPQAASGDAIADARAIAAACQSLDDLAAALTAFDACPLKRTATQLCFADGNPNARVMLIGEAPGRDEDIRGKPFVGRSGQLLDRMLAAAGLSRLAQQREFSVYITNAIFWRPPGNRTPTEAETAMCLPFLMRAIELQRPDFIVCLGATPTQRLTGRSDGILKLRGKWFDFELAGRKLPLLATLHPAYLLRQPAQKRLAWRDLLNLRQALDAN